MASVNKVILIGYVGRDAECRYTTTGKAVTSFSLATSETWGGKDGSEKKEQTEWHNIVCWGRQAEVAGQYIKKGMHIYLEGRLQTRNWVDPQGVKHYKTEINCRIFQFLDKKSDSGGSYGGGEYKGSKASGQHGQSAAKADPAASGPDEYDIGDLGPPLDMDDKPLS